MTDDEYSKAIKAVAREARMPAKSVTRMEKALLSAFADRHATCAPPTRARAAWLPWLAVAAAVIVVAGSVAVWRVNVVGVTKGNHVVAPKALTSQPAGVPVDAKPVTPFVVATTHPPRHPSSRRGSPRPNVVRPSGFIELPGTAGLPAFESGEIVRMEVPVASLPAYGIDISSGADRPVEADILIGQDGLARAIRLVTSTARSTQ